MTNLQNQPLELFVRAEKPVYAHVSKGGMVILTDQLNHLPQYNAAEGPNWINVCLTPNPNVQKESGFYPIAGVLEPTDTKTKIDAESGFEIANENELAVYKSILVLALSIAQNMIEQGHLCKMHFFRYDVDFDERNELMHGNVHQVAHRNAPAAEQVLAEDKVAL